MLSDRLAGGARPWLGAMAGTFAIALLVRVVAVMTWSRHLDPQGDEAFYWRQAQYLSGGAGFVYRNKFGEQVHTAVHPPLYSAYLGLVGLLPLAEASHLPYRLATAFVGAATVALIAFATYRLAGRTAAWAAGLLAAVYPNLWFNEVKLTAESLYSLTVIVVVIAAHRYWVAPSVRQAMWLGGAVAMAALARAEALVLFGLLVVPLAFLIRDRPVRRRITEAGAAMAVGLVVLAPWLVRNLTSFASPATISSGSGFVVEISNCDQTFGLAPPKGPGEASLDAGQADQYLGYWVPACDRSDVSIHGANAVPWPDGDETEVERWKRGIGLDYVRAHRSELPVVVAARVGRIWDVWRPQQSIDLNTLFEGRSASLRVGGIVVGFQSLAMAQYYVLLGLAAVGIFRLRRSGHTVMPYVALAVSATLAAALSFGITRYRVGVDVALCVLGGVAIAHLLRPRRATVVT